MEKVLVKAGRPLVEGFARDAEMPGGQGDVLAVLLPENGVLREWH